MRPGKKGLEAPEIEHLAVFRVKISVLGLRVQDVGVNIEGLGGLGFRV